MHTTEFCVTVSIASFKFCTLKSKPAPRSTVSLSWRGVFCRKRICCSDQEIVLDGANLRILLKLHSSRQVDNISLHSLTCPEGNRKDFCNQKVN